MVFVLHFVSCSNLFMKSNPCLWLFLCLPPSSMIKKKKTKIAQKNILKMPTECLHNFSQMRELTRSYFFISFESQKNEFYLCGDKRNGFQYNFDAKITEISGFSPAWVSFASTRSTRFQIFSLSLSLFSSKSSTHIILNLFSASITQISVMQYPFLSVQVKRLEKYCSDWIFLWNQFLFFCISKTNGYAQFNYHKKSKRHHFICKHTHTPTNQKNKYT